jgi:hypothetical protein
MTARLLVFLSFALCGMGQWTGGVGVQRLSGHNNHNHHLLGAVNCDDVEEGTFDGARVDNFVPSSGTWRQRYFINRKLWAGKGAPIFVFIGGEGEEGCGRLTDRMSLYELAKEHNALLLDVEHRFYGRSVPTQDVSTESLRYLTSEQALADLARIIQFVKTEFDTESSPVITVGGSYPGNLAAFFRAKYPSVTDGSIASSAPVTATVNFSGYMDVVAQAIEFFGGQKCLNAFTSAADEVYKLYSQGVKSEGMKKLAADFSVCHDITSMKDVAVLLSDLMGNVQGTVQYNNEHNGVLNVTDICAIMVKGDDPYTQFVSLSSEYRKAAGQTCDDGSWADTIAFLSNSTLVLPANAARSWVYQTCVEFGYFQTADSPLQPFYSWRDLLSTQFSSEICSAAYPGLHSPVPDVAWTNTVYGGLEIVDDSSNIVYTSGTIDPWHFLGVTNYTKEISKNKDSIVYIQGTAHCADLYAPANSDPDTLTFARQVVAEKVRGFLSP